MILRVIGSGSAGNSYLLQSEQTGEVLAIEAGIRLTDVKRAIDYHVSSIVGCLISHEHGDHAGQIVRYIHAAVPCYMSCGTAEALGRIRTYGVHLLQPLREVEIGSFRVIPFPVNHDAREPLGFMIDHEESGVIVFATDTYYLRNRFTGVSNWIIECNYRQDILQRNCEAGLIDPMRRDRTLKSHMSYETCRQTLLANDLTMTNNIVLIHLSSDNADATAFVRGIQEATHHHVCAAHAGLTMAFNKTPF